MGGVPSHSLGRWVTEMAGGQGMGEGMKRKGVFINKEICQYCWELTIKKRHLCKIFASDIIKKNSSLYCGS